MDGFLRASLQYRYNTIFDEPAKHKRVVLLDGPFLFPLFMAVKKSRYPSPLCQHFTQS